MPTGMGGDQGGLRDGPPNLSGDGPCLRPPNILITTVIGFEAKFEMTKIGHEEFRVVKLSRISTS